MNSSSVFESFELPNGQSLNNRIIKAAMEEGLAESGQLPGMKTFELYKTWAKGGAAVLITGNVMVDDRAFTGPAGLALTKATDIAPYQQWANDVHQNNSDCKLWMQINHPGRQVFAAMKGVAWAPSAIAVDLGKHSKFFAQPIEMTEDDIQTVIQLFVDTALQARKAGFDGVQIHAAHGYLLSQFLSPVSNQRQDKWGGSIENRARLLIEVVKNIVQALGNQRSDFALSVKLNSADFQRGGFSEEDAAEVVKMLNTLGVDMLELSGGSYESPAMQGRTADGRTLQREAYFLDFAKQLAELASIPVMTTGGIRRRATAEKVLAEGIDCVGIATALSIRPELPKVWQQHEELAEMPAVNWNDKGAASMATMALVKRQFHRMAKGKKPDAHLSPVVSLIWDQVYRKKMTKRYNKEYEQRRA